VRTMRVVVVLTAVAISGVGVAGTSVHGQSRHQFQLSVSGGVFPIISGETDAPEGTRIFVNLTKPLLPDAQQRMARGLPGCGEDCVPATGPNHLFGVETVAIGGRFTAGPFSFGGEPFRPNVYPVEIYEFVNMSEASLAEAKAATTPVYVTKIEVTANGDAVVPHADGNKQSRTDVKPAFFANPLRGLPLSK
jgi:hypothetical protein